MPDYTLPRNNSQSPQPQQPLPPQPQAPSAAAQLSAASHQLKMETENALLREALATSAQSCEALMKQLVESQAEFQRQVRETIELSQKAYMGIYHDTKTGLEKAYSLMERNNQNQLQQINQYNQSHLNQLSKLENMNQVFSQSLKSVLTPVTDKLIAQVKADTDIALQANYDTMLSIIQTMEMTSSSVTDNTKTFAQTLNDEFKKSKGILDNRVKRYNSSMERLFALDDNRKFFFWAGIVGSIGTLIALLIILLFHIFG